jgi:hypothetical protein
MTDIAMKFITSDGMMHDTRRLANTHQRILDARGMLENLLALTFSAQGLPDDNDRDVLIANMLYTHKDNVIDLLKGKPIDNPDMNPADVEATAEETIDHPELVSQPDVEGWQGATVDLETVDIAV